jgi:arabinogalactan oligomer/maltooligosaccharide transport system permease protein
MMSKVDLSRRYGKFAAGALIGSLPIMIIYLVLQDQVARGLATGTVKG